MNPALQRNLFLVKEHRGIFKSANNFDILDPQTGRVILECREPRMGPFTKVLRFSKYKNMTPFDVQVSTPDGAPVLSVKRGISIFLSKVAVFDETGRTVGGFQQKLFSIGGKFDIQDAGGDVVCTLSGSWTGWEFKFVTRSGQQLAQVSKKWMGLGREFFTSADNYVITVDESLPLDDPRRLLIMAAVLCIDMVLKE